MFREVSGPRLPFFAVLLCLLTALLFAACGGDDSEPAAGASNESSSGESEAKEEEPLKIGLVQDERAAAEPWSAALHDAAVKLKEKEPNVEFTETYGAFDPTAAEPVARQFLQQGYAAVVFHSFALEDVAKKLAKEFPDVPMSLASFLPPQPPNLSIETASYLQTGYANCWLLARLSETGKIGVVGAQPAPYAEELLQGCKLGAEAANPDVEVASAWSNSFTDAQATLEQSRTLQRQGIDGLFPSSATKDSLGGFKACEQLKINCVGWAADSRRYAPNTTVTSVVIDWSVLLEDMIAAARAGEPQAETFDATFANAGLVTPEFDGPSAERVPEDVREEFAQVIQDLVDEAIELPKSKAHPCCP